MQPMKAASFEEVDGIKLVTAIIDPIPDPEATLEMARLEVAASGFRDRFDELVRRGKATEPGDAEAIADLKTDVARYAFEHSIAVRDRARQNPVYFSYVPGETLLQQEFAEELRTKLKGLEKHERLTISGSVIQDNRGRAYYFQAGGKWKQVKITRIGETKPNADGYRWRDELSERELREIEDQQEDDRIEKLSPTERRIQAALEIEMAAKNCANMRSTLEIKGDNDALRKARFQFEQLKAEIIERYKLSGEFSNADQGRPKPKEDDGDQRRDS